MMYVLEITDQPRSVKKEKEVPVFDNTTDLKNFLANRGTS